MTEQEYFEDVKVTDGFLIIKAEPYLVTKLKNLKLTGKELALGGRVVKAGDDLKQYEGMQAYWGINTPPEMFDRMRIEELHDTEDEISSLYFKIGKHMVAYYKPIKTEKNG